jgi:hypothetical protein
VLLRPLESESAISSPTYVPPHHLFLEPENVPWLMSARLFALAVGIVELSKLIVSDIFAF